MPPRRRTFAPRSYLWRLRPYFGQLRNLLVIGSLAGFLMNVFVVAPPLLLGHAIDVARSAQRGASTVHDVGLAGLLFVAGTAASEIPRMAKRYWLGVARNRFVASVRADALRGTLENPQGVDALPVGDIMARIIGDVDVLGTAVGEVIVETWDTLLFSVSLIVAMVVLFPWLAVLALAPVPLALTLAQRSGIQVATRTRHARESESHLTTALREYISSLRVLRLFGRLGATTQRIDVLAQTQAKVELAAIGLDEGLGALYSVVLSAGVVAIFWWGGIRVVRGHWSLGDLVAFLGLFVRFTTRAPRIPQMLNRVQAGGAAYERLTPLLAPPISVTHEPRAATLSSTHIPSAPVSDDARAPSRAPGTTGAASVTVRGVSYEYPGAANPALVGIDFYAPPGSLVVITGPLASGKSTLARLAAGLLAPSSGSVEIGEELTTTLSDRDRALRVGFLSQEPHLFSGSVAENVAMFSLDTSEEFQTALNSAVTRSALDRDLERFAHGSATQIGERGVRISGGQRQRISLARALLASGPSPSLLVLDDPFSAADVRTEVDIIDALRDAYGKDAPVEQRATIILVSHRLAACAHADLVVLLARGCVVEQGTHAELLAARGDYARIVRAQSTLESTMSDPRTRP